MSLDAEDVIRVEGRYLVRGDNKDRFFVRGIAFPDAPPTRLITEENGQHIQYNATGWISILQQLRDSSDELNTIRLYQLDDPSLVDYSEFFHAAADLGFYILVPLTATFGNAILNRALPAPHCYTKALWGYGTRMLHFALDHPNVIAGIIGNEVMNSIESWRAAPCIKAYARDLKQYMKSQLLTDHKYKQRGALIPLMYAAQDSGIGAALSNVDTIRLTVDYLSCRHHNNAKDDASVDILGVNLESWCSSYNTFETNMDGTPGIMFQMWQGLHTSVHAPLVFSELGCSHSRFNRDSPEFPGGGTRDWTEVPVVLQEMADTWSGFCSFAYWGNSLFNMMSGGPWNGRDVLIPTRDFENFQQQCAIGTQQKEQQSALVGSVVPGSLHDLPMQNGGIMESYYQSLAQNPHTQPTCAQVEEALAKTCKLELYDFEKMPSYYSMSGWWFLVVMILAVSCAAVAGFWWSRQRQRGTYERIPDPEPTTSQF
ncbi:glucanosyltransferase gel1 [Seminavis robusta]|uniref:Glucanosyltransferase gel1 n=1 Tax=Seminavis robusta TaxID=568900 RepID=A0A9N8HVL6_9STRA|nr:glucanosyltransferase gel1 [Seminavis robusta]|eukprot:Sro1967_g308350.1 glucanosyltransferase gel1 (484) ;mRNA; f:11345-12883